MNNSIKKGLIKFINHINMKYLSSSFKKKELVLCIVILFLLSFTINKIIPFNYRGLFSQIILCINIYMCVRFAYLGFIIIAPFNLIQVITLSTLYTQTHDINLLIGLETTIITIIIAYIVSFLSNKQELQKRKLEKLSITDELTNVYNQRYFHSRLEIEIQRAQKNKKELTLILLDIDNFKTYNDIFGHDVGDNILSHTSTALNSLLKENEILCRYGGDEFAIILLNTESQNSEKTAIDIREKYELLKKRTYKDELMKKITFSMGLSEYPKMASNKDELISQADMALYHAKNLGKDKVHLYQDVILQLRKHVSIDHQQLIGVFKGLLSTISAKDKYTLGHCERVASYAVMIGEEMQLSVREITYLQYSGLLHDIGKIEMPKSLLNKIGYLSAEEIDLIQKHPIYSENILESLEGMHQLIDYVRHHHEKFDGTGYPDGIKGNKISLGARILCVGDCFDAMISERPYRKSKTINEAFNELEKCAGTHFDPEIVKIFIKIMQSKVVTKPIYNKPLTTIYEHHILQ